MTKSTPSDRLASNLRTSLATISANSPYETEIGGRRHRLGRISVESLGDSVGSRVVYSRVRDRVVDSPSIMAENQSFARQLESATGLGQRHRQSPAVAIPAHSSAVARLFPKLQ